MMADCRVSMTAQSNWVTPLVKECFKEPWQTATQLGTVDGEFRDPSACYNGGGKESTRITSTLHFPASDTQGRAG